jgi:integrase
MARLRGDGWQGDVRLRDGSRKRRGGFPTEAQALAWEAAMKLADEEGRPLPSAAPGQAAKGITMGALQRQVATMEWRDARASASLIRNGQCAVDFFGANVLASAITTSEVDRYIRALIDAGNANGTINRKLAALSKLLRYAHKRGLIETVPHFSRRTEPQGREREVSPAEERAILATLRLWGEHLYADFVEYLIDTGCRWESEGHASLWTAYNGRKVTYWFTKGGKPRTIPLTDRAHAAVERQRGQAGGPWHGINSWRFRDSFTKACAHTGIEDVVIHTLRHTCCTRLVRAGVDLSRVMIWMGHRSFTTTLRYRHLSPTDLEGMASLLEPGAGVVPKPVPKLVAA